MEHIIQQIALNLVEEITKKAIGEKLIDLDALAAEIFEDCTDAARRILQETIRIRNLKIREDKEFRKKEGLVIKEKDRPREIHTKLGVIRWERDYYYDKKEGHYVYPLDHMLGIRNYERIGDEVCAELLSRATEVSYARSADIVTGGTISRQSVHNHLLKAEIPEKLPEEEGKEVKALNIYADEDHVHIQKPRKVKGKCNRKNPLVTVTEGTEKVSASRNRTLCPMHFVDEEQNTKELWKSVEGYIAKAYDVGRIEAIYIHADGGNWIKNGLKSFSNVIPVMDGYHFHKELKKIARRHPEHKVKKVILDAIKENDRKKADLFLQELIEEDEEAKAFGKYLFGHWEAIRNLLILDIPGSCTEGQISHVLSERFSRSPMAWSPKGLGKLSKLRVYKQNGGKFTGKDLKPEKEHERYSEYAERYVEEYLNETIDWSIFEREAPIMNGSYGTQTVIRKYGTDYGVVVNRLS